MLPLSAHFFSQTETLQGTYKFSVFCLINGVSKKGQQITELPDPDITIHTTKHGMMLIGEASFSIVVFVHFLVTTTSQEMMIY